MKRTTFLRGASALTLVTALACSAAHAQTKSRDQGPVEVEEIIVTGSFIRGTPEDASLPVDVIGAEDLQKQGSPSTVELLKALPVSNGVLGDTNQFDSRAQGSEGSGSVNLRGLGSQRTLVLFNGRRMAINPLAAAGAGIVDTNIIPAAAIGRIEVLKDGAAATYGSDAIAGVVNFITKKNFNGLEAGADYRFIDGSKGDYGLNVTYGKVWDNANFLGSIGWQHRSKLSVADRDWANKPYLTNPEAGWSAAGNPSTFIPAAASTTGFRDPSCSTLGGFAGFSGLTPVCYWHYSPFDNLVEKQDAIQAYGEVNADLSAKTKFHAEVLYSHTDVPDWNTSPSYAALAVPTAEAAAAPTLAGRYYVPANNPGLIAFMAANPTITTTSLVTGAQTTVPSTILAGGAINAANRPYGLGGNPAFGYGPSIGARAYDAFRVSSDLSGEFDNGIGWDIALTYSQEVGIRTGYDTLVNRFELALRGLGGSRCDTDAATPGIQGTPGVGGCLFYNPFANAIPGNAITGVANPAYNSALANSEEVTRWFFQKLSTKQSSRLFVGEAVLNGKTNITLPGGDIAWAAGVQYRRTYFKADYNNISNAAINPCVNTPDFGVTNCTGSVRNGPFMFLGVGTEADKQSGIMAGFGELSLPITQSVQMQLAARYEDYGGATGSTFNPKAAIRWQATKWMAFRASAGSTFRGPPDPQLVTSSITSLQSILGVFRAVDIYGNPNLQPEEANTYNAGVLFKTGAFKASIDYFRFDFKKPIVAEPVAGMVSALYPNGATGANNCGVAAFAALQSRFTYNTNCNTISSIARLRTNYVNGPDIRNSGFDFSADYLFEGVLGGNVALGTNATYISEYKVSAQTVEGVVVSPAFDAVGKLNYQTIAVPIPQWKGDVYAQWSMGPHNLRATVHYIDSYTDRRTAPFATGAYKDTTGAPVTVSAGKTIDKQILTDLAYRVFLPWDTTLTAAITNVFDKDPSYARLDLGYDPFTGDPLGRTYKMGIRKKF
ncbi:TonB-dependent receptor [Caulobacter sp. DWP3-1-3b2]|uniref:TonB-dependent receptor n=1 Tax=Caulobacter sp. DWP3-1-3b2 TaxID=2804643 RepID=UPI003CEC971B